MNDIRTTNDAPRVRFAPSPTGNLHIGSARTALFNWLFARANKGTFILRVEDTDKARSTIEFEKSILDDLAWLGLDYDEGPQKGNYGPYHQSKRFDKYQKKAKELIDSDKAYYCYCSPEELQQEKKKALLEGRTPGYSGRCKKLTDDEIADFKSQGRKPSVRFDVGEGDLVVDDLIYSKVSFSLSEISDFIILRPDNSPTFHLAVVVDDGEMQISHVIRGEDHLSNTPKHILLFVALGYRCPKFAHIPIILGPDKAKLSKRHGATAISTYKEKGYLSTAIVNYLSLLSWSPPTEQEILNPGELIDIFDLHRVSKSPAIFDADKLVWINGQHIRKLDDNTLVKLVKPLLSDKNMTTSDDRLILIAGAIKKDLNMLSEAPEYAKVFFDKKISYAPAVIKHLEEKVSNQALSIFNELFSKKVPKDFDEAKSLIKEYNDTLKPLGIKGKQAFMPIRLALTAAYSGPELFYLITILDSSTITHRLNKSIQLVG